jgi:CheY-specific phosphatase CheX
VNEQGIFWGAKSTRRRKTMKDRILGRYIAKNHSDNVFTDRELQVIKQGDTDTLVETFLHMDNDYYKTQMQCTLKSLGMFMDGNIELNQIDYEREYKGQFIGCQVMDGDIDVFLGIAGDNVELLKLASTFAQEDIEEFDEDAYDALCELINVMNGAYATKLGEADIEVTLHPPVFYKDTEVTADTGFYVVTFNIEDNVFKILMAADNKIQLSA